jgi:hypothetical protein
MRSPSKFVNCICGPPSTDWFQIFNRLSSIGVILFGALYGYLAMWYSALLFHSCFLVALGFALLLGYAGLAKVYWFRVPFRGIVLAAVLYLLGIVVHLA